MTTVAVMQPYFFPHAGYYRLFAHADVFVILDCVQFPRRGYVHRNQLPGPDGRACWLTLPVVRTPGETRISDLRFPPDAPDRLAGQRERFPSLAHAAANADRILDALWRLDGTPLAYLEATLAAVCSELGLSCTTVRSSSLNVPDDLRGQDRVLAICDALGARRYVNAPGAWALYDPTAFRKRGIDLCFLSSYRGSRWSILHRLLTEPRRSLVQEVEAAA